MNIEDYDFSRFGVFAPAYKQQLLKLWEQATRKGADASMYEYGYRLPHPWYTIVDTAYVSTPEENNCYANSPIRHWINRAVDWRLPDLNTSDSALKLVVGEDGRLVLAYEPAQEKVSPLDIEDLL